MKTSTLTAALASFTTIALLASACGSSGNDSSSTGSSDGANPGSGDKLQVVAAFYPLEYALQRIGGDHLAITSLTKPGAEPHDLELTPQDTAKISGAKLAVYEAGFQSAVDKAIADQSPAGAYDVSKDADLSLAAPPDEDETPKAQGTATPAPPASTTSDAHNVEKDPHFWLDPQRYTKVVQGIATKLGQVDGAHKADYDKNAAALVAELGTLDTNYRTGLAKCTNKTIVTSHAAFGYLSQRYGLTQEPIAGLSPEQEPDPKRLAEISAYAKAHKVTTIYTETLASPAVAQTVAKETGAQTAVLDPIEGITDTSAGKNYLEVMNSNLTTLKKGQSCA